MNNDILISVIVPIYNVEQFLSKCIQSIINQSYSRLEIILVDDGSTDDSPQICDEFKEKDKRIKVIHKKNGGLSDARNVGIEVASGEYIGFVDSDDYIDELMYEKLLNACIRNNSYISICGRNIVNIDNDILCQQFTVEKEVVYDGKTAIKKLLLWDSCDSAAWDKLYKKELFEDLKYPLGVWSEDYAVTSRIFAKADKIVHVGEALYYYVQREGSITKQGFSEKKYDTMKQVYSLTNFVKKIYAELDEECEYFVGNHLLNLMRCARLQKKSCNSRELYIKLYNECKKNITVFFRCPYFTFKDKIKYCIKLIILKVTIILKL